MRLPRHILPTIKTAYVLSPLIQICGHTRTCGLILDRCVVQNILGHDLTFFQPSRTDQEVSVALIGIWISTLPGRTKRGILVGMRGEGCAIEKLFLWFTYF